MMQTAMFPVGRVSRVGGSLRVLLVAVLLGVLGSVPGSAQDGTIAGTVVDKATAAAVADAAISIEGSERAVVSNGVGRFRIASLEGGSVTLVVKAAGFLDGRVEGVQPDSEGALALRIELQPTPNYMERVQVTATKAPLTLGELAAQTDIVDRATIEERNDQSLTQAVAHVPGLIVSTQAGSFESVTLRGLPRDGNEFTTTLLLIDGIPQTDSRNSARVVNLPINDAETIEVMRGPSSALYGRTAIGGAVNLRTADPSPDHKFGLDLTAGDFSTYRGLARVSGPVAEWGGYYVSGSLEETESFYTGPFDFEVERNSLFGKLAFVPSSSSFGNVSLNRVRSDQSTPTNVPIVDGVLLTDIEPLFDRFSNLNLPGPNYHQEEDRFTGTYSWQLGSASNLVALLGYREIQYKFIDDGDVTGSPFDLDANTMTMYPFDLQSDEDILYSELRFETTPSTRSNGSFLAGGSFESNSGFSAGNLIYTDADTFGMPIDYLDPVHPPREEWSFFRFGGHDYNLDSTGIFAQYIFEPGTRWVITAGARYDRLDLDNTRVFLDGKPRTEESFDAVSPKLSAVFKLFEGGRSDLSLYGSYSEAFLPPRRPTQLSPTTNPVSLEPEDIDNFEIGLKGSTAGGDLSYEGTYFVTRRDGIVHSVRQGPFFLPTNAGEHEYEGFETGLRFSPGRLFDVYANGAFYHNRFGDFVIESPGGDTDLTGNRLPISPDLVLNGGVTVRPLEIVDVVLNIKYVGDVMMDQGNTFEIDPYTLVDLAASVHLRRVRLTLSAHNLFDEKYFWNGDTSNAESADVGRPRQVLLTAAFGFGGG